MLKSFLLAAVLAAFPLADLAAEAAPGGKKLLTPQDIWAMKRLGTLRLSPDGAHAVFTVTEFSIEKDKSTQNLYLLETATGKVRRLTHSESSDGAPTWSPDSQVIAFTSKRGEDKVPALYQIRIDGGEAQEILELPFAIQHPRWLPDGKRIVFSTRVLPALAGDRKAMAKEVKRRKDSKISAKVSENRTYRFWDTWQADGEANRLMVVTVADKSVKDLTPKRDFLFQMSAEVEFDVSPDGKYVALTMNSTPPPFRDEPNNDIYLVSTEGSEEPKNLTPDNKKGDTHPIWAPDGKSIYFGRQVLEVQAGEIRRLWRHDLATGKNTLVSGAHDLGFDDWKFSADGKTLYFIAENKGSVPIFSLNAADGSGLKTVVPDGSCADVAVGKNGRLFFLQDSMNAPTEVFSVELANGQRKQLTNFNTELLAKFDLGKTESRTFKSNGKDVQMWLVYPPRYDASKKYGLVQILHGGPQTMVRDTWGYRWNPHIFAAGGYFTAHINRTGSTGFGEKFARDINENWGDVVMADIMAGTDDLLAKFPSIDPQRMAAAGGSYGGYLASWLLGHTDRFKCLISHAGVHNFFGQWAGDVTYGWNHVLGGVPWRDIPAMNRQNPMFFAKNFKTPTLVIHGELDYRVPVTQGLELYGVLQAMGVPSRLVYYPNENHWILKPQNSIHWYGEFRGWLARYIGGEALPEFKPGPPEGAEG
ncbi:MAG: S9 family peptidase [Verrucomicrobia bacterium]|nr:S9 family peptidase [Verrucomicrobiota bacterium]